MLKRVISIILAVIMCLALASCTIEQDIVIKEDETIEVNEVVTLSELELLELELMEKQMGEGLLTGEDTGGFPTSVAEFKAKSDEQGLTQTIDGVKYYTVSVESEYENLEQLNASLAESSVAANFTTTDAWMYSLPAQTEEVDTENMLGFETKAYMTIKMPYKVTDTNGEKLDDNTVKVDITNGYFLYIITENSTAEWTKAQDIEAAVIDMAKPFYTPAAVKGLKVSYASKDKLRITFAQPNEGYTTHYKVEKKVGNGKWQAFKTIDVYSDNVNYDYDLNIYCADKSFKAHKKYSYRVKAICKNSDFTTEGAYSKVKTITTTDLKTKPVLKVRATYKIAVLTLKKGTKNLTGYQIKYSTKKNFKNAKTVTTKKFPKTIKKLKSGTKYYFKVRKYRSGVGGKVFSPWSKSVNTTVK